MTKLKHDFNGLSDWRLPDAQEPVKAPAATQTSKKPKPFSLRLSFDERARLEQDASGMALGAYIRERLFGENVAPRQTHGGIFRSRIMLHSGGFWQRSGRRGSRIISTSSPRR